MKKLAFILCAVLLAFTLGGCAADDAEYTEYNGVKIPNEDIENMDVIYMYGSASELSREELLQRLAYQQVQIDEAERLGLMPSKGEVEAYYQKQLIEPVMAFLGSDDQMEHENALFALNMWQDERERLGMTHDEYCDYVISRWQKILGMGALQQYVLSEKGLTPGEMSIDVYSEYVDGLLAQAASAAAQN